MMKAVETTRTQNTYDCDFCPNGEGIFQANDVDYVLIPEGWVVLANGGHKCPECVSGEPINRKWQWEVHVG